MKKNNIISFLLFVSIFVTVLILPYKVSAQNYVSPYKMLNEGIEIVEIDNLTFKSLSFIDNTDTSTLSFGVNGDVYNNSEEDIIFKSVINYYDKNYNIITSNSKEQTISAKQNIKFAQMSDIMLLPNNYSIDDVYYYRVAFIPNLIENTTEVIENITPSEIPGYSKYPYVIDSYDIDIVVNENNILDITEKITAYFNVPRHGITRLIPLSNDVVRLDGTTSTVKTKVRNLSVDNEYKTSKESGNLNIRIGSANKNITGKQEYVIKYNYNLGRDVSSNYDELYFNIIGDNWDTVIGNISFQIKMPKEFDVSKLGFSSGKTGSIDNDRVEYTVSGNTISGKYNGILKSYEALTVRLELDEGYFVGAKNLKKSIKWLLILIPIVSLIIVTLFRYIFGNKRLVVPPAEFYPPNNLNSLDIAYLYKGEANEKDVISLLIYLAHKGYIKIVDINTPKNKNGFKLIKLKEYDGNDVNEYIFLHNLFCKSRKKEIKKGEINQLKKLLKNKDKSSDQKDGITNIKEDFSKLEKKLNGDTEEDESLSNNETTNKELKYRFFSTINNILSNINSMENNKKIIEKDNKLLKFISILLIFVSIVSIILLPTFVNNDDILLDLIILIIFSLPFNIIMYKIVKDKPFPKVLLSLLPFFVVIIIDVSFVTLFINDTVKSPIYILNCLLGGFCVYYMIKYRKELPVRTEYGNEMYGRILGFRDFLNTVEKEKLEELVLENPNYFYDILPYTYVLGLSKKWIKKFENITLADPDWYESDEQFKFSSLDNLINNDVYTSAPRSTSSGSDSSSDFSSSSSSHSSSGGGSSGGGSGGGGGRSW